MNRKSFLGKLLIGFGAIVTAPYLPKLSASVVELQNKNIELIAGWMRISRMAMNNIPAFLAYLEKRLPEVLLKENGVQKNGGLNEKNTTLV